MTLVAVILSMQIEHCFCTLLSTQNGKCFASSWNAAMLKTHTHPPHPHYLEKTMLSGKAIVVFPLWIVITLSTVNLFPPPPASESLWMQNERPVSPHWPLLHSPVNIKYATLGRGSWVTGYWLVHYSETIEKAKHVKKKHQKKKQRPWVHFSLSACFAKESGATSLKSKQSHSWGQLSTIRTLFINKL